MELVREYGLLNVNNWGVEPANRPPPNSTAIELLAIEINRYRQLMDDNEKDPVKYRVYSRCLMALVHQKEQMKPDPMREEAIKTWKSAHAHWNTEFME